MPEQLTNIVYMYRWPSGEWLYDHEHSDELHRSLGDDFERIELPDYADHDVLLEDNPDYIGN